MLYLSKHSSSITDKYLVFPDIELCGLNLKILAEGTNLSLICPVYVDEENCYSFCIKPILCEQGSYLTNSEIVQFCQDTYELRTELTDEDIKLIKQGEYSNSLDIRLKSAFDRASSEFSENPYHDAFIQVDFAYFEKMISNLNILYSIDPSFKLIEHAELNAKFFGFYVPFQNTTVNERGNAAYDGAFHGAGCALQTNYVYSNITRMCFQREEKVYVSHNKYLFKATKLMGAKRIITCQDSGSRDGGTRRLIPLLMYYALTGGYPKVLKFIEAFWKDADSGSKGAILALMSPNFSELEVNQKIAVYQELPGYVEAANSKLKKVGKLWRKNLLNRLRGSN